MSKRRAFSIIELLVVIAVIALILAVLLPALSNSRQQGHGVKCLANLRSLAAGWDMYAADNDDISAPGRMANLPGGTSNPSNFYDVGNGLKYRPRWAATIGKYVGIHAFDAPIPADDAQDYDGAVYQCPAVAERMDARNHAYGYNHQFLGNSRTADGRYINFPVNRATISSFGGTVLAADCLGTAAGVPSDERAPYKNGGTGFNELGNHGWTLDPPRLTALSDRGTGDAGSPRTAVDPRHLGKSNVVYCDGHGERVTPQYIGYRVAPDGTYLEVGGPSSPPHNQWFSGTGRDDDPPSKIAAPP